MQGLKLSRRYYEEYCAPMLLANFPEPAGRIAAGLVGEGSECFGFDDEISQDHDWGAAVCLWLVDEDFKAHGPRLQSALEATAREAYKLPLRRESPMASGRSGALEISAFYFRHIGFADGPHTLFEWLRTPEDRLATVTNGAIFADPLGKFSAIRDRLLAFYPEDVRRKKLAARLAQMAQAGQYNLERCGKRGETVAARLAEALFIKESMAAAFLLNRRYMPFYKWAHRALRGLPILGLILANLLEGLTVAEHGRKVEGVEEICALIVAETRRQGLSEATDDFLLQQALTVQSGIENDDLRGLHVFVG